jgi:hypothetical protein
MKTKIIRTVGFSVAAFFAGQEFCVQAAEGTKEPVDRGPFVSATIRANYPGENIAMKGIVVTLGTETNAFICYDTDLMRVSVAWTGDYLKFGNYMKEIVHPQPPQVRDVTGAPEPHRSRRPVDRGSRPRSATQR